MESEENVLWQQKGWQVHADNPDPDYGREGCHGVDYYKFCSSWAVLWIDLQGELPNDEPAIFLFLATKEALNCLFHKRAKTDRCELVICNTRNRKPEFAVYPTASAGCMELRNTVRRFQGLYLQTLTWKSQDCSKPAIDELGEFYD